MIRFKENQPRQLHVLGCKRNLVLSIYLSSAVYYRKMSTHIHTVPGMELGISQ